MGAGPAHHQLDGADRPRGQGKLLELVALAFEPDRFVGEGRADVAEGLLEHLEAFGSGRVIEAEHLVLSVQPTGPDAKHKAPARHAVDGDGGLRQHGGVPEGNR